MAFVQSSIYSQSRFFLIQYPSDKESQVMNQLLSQNHLDLSLDSMKAIYHQLVRDIQLANYHTYYTEVKHPNAL